MIECEKDGIWLIDKPLGMTSFGVVQRMRRILKLKKIGHAGTLDPLATGLMIICSGKFTKQIEGLMGMEKEYTGSFYLGAVTESYDLEKPPVITGNAANIQSADLGSAASSLTGLIQQIPPVHSAIKVDGKRAYESARKGHAIELKPREVHIKSFELGEYHFPEVAFKVKCSKGTYIRTLAHDFGQLLGTGAYLSSLRRTSIGPFKIEEAMILRDLETVLNEKPVIKNGMN